METIIAKRGPGESHDLSEVIIDIAEFSRWTNYHPDSIRACERKGFIHRIPNSGFVADGIFSYLLASTADETGRARIKSWKVYLRDGTEIPANLYVEADQERLERERAEFEANKSPSTRRLEREIELSEKESSLRYALKQIASAKSEVEALKLQIKTLEASIPTFESRVNDARERFDQADQIVKDLEAARNFQPTFEPKEDAIVVHPDDYSDISHGKRSVKSKK